MMARSNDDGAMTIRSNDGAMTIRSNDGAMTIRSNNDGAIDGAIDNVMRLITRWRDDAISVAMQWCD